MSAAAQDNLARLRVDRNVIMLQLITKVSSEVAEAQIALANAEQQAEAATAGARQAARAQAVELSAKLSKLRQDLRTYAANVSQAASEELAVLEAKAAAATGNAKQQAVAAAELLRAKRDAFVKATAYLVDGTGADRQQAAASFTQSVRDLVASRAPSNPPTGNGTMTLERQG